MSERSEFQQMAIVGDQIVCAYMLGAFEELVILRVIGYDVQAAGHFDIHSDIEQSLDLLAIVFGGTDIPEYERHLLPHLRRVKDYEPAIQGGSDNLCRRAPFVPVGSDEEIGIQDNPWFVVSLSMIRQLYRDSNHLSVYDSSVQIASGLFMRRTNASSTRNG